MMATEALDGAARVRFARDVEHRLLRGEHFVVLGPRGMGKTTLARWLSHALRQDHVPCGLAERASSLGDVTRALDLAYERAAQGAPTQRRARSRLRLAAEHARGALILDHVEAVPLAMRGFLRSLRGGLVGVAYFVDVDAEREHAKMRGWHLGHVELALPPLPARAMRGLISRTSHRLDAAAVAHVTRVARGRPGFVLRCLELAQRDEYWRAGRLHRTVLCGDAEIAVRCSAPVDHLIPNLERKTS